MRSPLVGAVIGLVLVFLIVLIGNVFARDDGRYAQSPLKPWFESLRSKAGAPCCDGSDGVRLADPDWERNDKGDVRVRIKGRWYDVPDSAMVTVPNRAGAAMVWPVGEGDGLQIRCFMFGTLS